MKKYLTMLAGCALIALSYNIFFMPYGIVPNGLYGISTLLNIKLNIPPALFLAIAHIVFLTIYLLTRGFNKTKQYLVPALIIPILVFLTENISEYIEFKNLELILITVVGGVLNGLGYSLIYKQGYNVINFGMIQNIFNDIKKRQNLIFSVMVEVVILLVTIFVFDITISIYSFVAIMIIKYISTKTKVGINTSKTFFIITSKEQEIKDYIIKELNHDLTEFNVKGGYSNHKNKILMTVIDTKDYYKLKEGIYIIDKEAFISIIDSYEVINKNKTLEYTKTLQNK